MMQLPSQPAPSGAKPAASTARYVLHLLLLSLLSFAAAFALRRAFFWDIKPVSWTDTPPQNGALEAAFLLLTVENVAAVVAAIAAVFVVVMWVRDHWPAGSAAQPHGPR
jgi:hypothetical protein